MWTAYDSELEFDGDVAILSVSGETDLYTASRFKRDLDEAMSAASGALVLDLSDLDLIDSTALGVMMAALRRMTEERRALVLVVTHGHVLRIFTITGLQTTFRIAETRAEAVRRVTAGHGTRSVA